MRVEANTANYGSDPRREPASPPRGTRAGEREGMTVANERNKRKGVSDVGWQGTNDVSNEWALPAKRNRESPVLNTGPVSGSIQGMTDQADEQHVASIAAPPTPPLTHPMADATQPVPPEGRRQGSDRPGYLRNPASPPRRTEAGMREGDTTVTGDTASWILTFMTDKVLKRRVEQQLDDRECPQFEIETGDAQGLDRVLDQSAWENTCMNIERLAE